MKKLVYVLGLTTESGDEYVWVFNHAPTQDEVHGVFRRDIPEEYEAYTCSSWGVEEITVEDDL